MLENIQFQLLLATLAGLGLKVIDITTLASLQIVGWVDTPRHAIGVAVLGDYVYAQI